MVIPSLIQEFSTIFAEFKKFKETLNFILHSNTIVFEKFNLRVLEWLNFNDLEMELVESRSNTVWNQKSVDLITDLEIIESN